MKLLLALALCGPALAATRTSVPGVSIPNLPVDARAPTADVSSIPGSMNFPAAISPEIPAAPIAHIPSAAAPAAPEPQSAIATARAFAAAAEQDRPERIAAGFDGNAPRPEVAASPWRGRLAIGATLGAVGVAGAAAVNKVASSWPAGKVIALGAGDWVGQQPLWIKFLLGFAVYFLVALVFGSIMNLIEHGNILGEDRTRQPEPPDRPEPETAEYGAPASSSPADARITIKAVERDAAARCPLCRDALDAASKMDCAGCGTPMHAECFAEMGRCASAGCPSRYLFVPAEPPSLRAADFPSARDFFRRNIDG